MYFTHFDWTGARPNNVRHLVTLAALQRNFFGGVGSEHGRVVAGKLDTETGNQVFSHFFHNLPPDLRQLNSFDQRWRPNFPMPMNHMSPGFSRMWTDSRLPWRRRRWYREQQTHYMTVVNRHNPVSRRVEVQRNTHEGYEYNMLRMMSAATLHFSHFQEILENWVYQYTITFRMGVGEGVILGRDLLGVFNFAQRVRHRLEANIPWQPLLAMREHQLRLGSVYVDTPSQAPSVDFAPFVPTWFVNTSGYNPRWNLRPYFHASVLAAHGVG